MPVSAGGGNRKRVFENVVSIEAWHSKFDSQTRSATVHVDISFLRARLGEEPESPVRFDVALKRAEIVFIIPATEPLKVIQSSVKRESPRSGRAVVAESVTKSGTVRGQLGLNMTAPQNLAASVSAEAQAQASSERAVRIEQEAKGIEWAQAKDGAGNYKWSVWPGIGHDLLGKVWNAVTDPILTVLHPSEEISVIRPVCRIELRCKRDDISITNLHSKKGIFQGSLFDNKKAAAEAFIRKALSNRNLQVIHFEDPYGDVTLADIYVDDEIS